MKTVDEFSDVYLPVHEQGKSILQKAGMIDSDGKLRPGDAIADMLQGGVMETIEDRLKTLREFGAGDEQCVDCLSYGMDTLTVCKKCIADTPAFNKSVAALIYAAEKTKP